MNAEDAHAGPTSHVTCNELTHNAPMLYRFPKNVMSPLMVNRLVRFLSTVTYVQHKTPLSGRNTHIVPKLMPVIALNNF